MYLHGYLPYLFLLSYFKINIQFCTEGSNDMTQKLHHTHSQLEMFIYFTLLLLPICSNVCTII